MKTFSTYYTDCGLEEISSYLIKNGHTFNIVYIYPGLRLELDCSDEYINDLKETFPTIIFNKY